MERAHTCRPHLPVVGQRLVEGGILLVGHILPQQCISFYSGIVIKPFGSRKQRYPASDLRIQSGLFLGSSKGSALNQPEGETENEEHIQIWAGRLFSCSHSCETSLTFLGDKRTFLADCSAEPGG